MVVCSPSGASLRDSLLLAAFLAWAIAASSAWAGSAGTPEANVSISDLERLTQQIEDPAQREQLLKTLQALIVAAKQEQPPAAAPAPFDPRTVQSDGLFLAFGELTERLSEATRTLGQELASLPATLSALPDYLTRPDTLRILLHLGIISGMLVILAILLRFLAARLIDKLGARLPPASVWPFWRKVGSALLAVGLRVGPYVVLLVASGILLSLFPVGLVPSALVALAISTLIIYQLARTIGLELANPDAPTARLLPLSDATARQAWTWSLRLIRLSVVYYVVTRSLMIIGTTPEVYYLVHGILVIAFAIVLSVLVSRLARAGRPPSVGTAGEEQPRVRANVMATLQGVWPIIALAYIWCAAFFAVASFQQGVSYLMVASLQMALVIGLSFLLLWAVNLAFAKTIAMQGSLGPYLPGLEARVLRYLKFIWWSVRLLIIVLGTLIILHVWGIGIFWFFTSPVGSDLLTRLVILALTVAVVALVVDFSSFLSRRLMQPGPDGGEPSKKRKTLIPLLSMTIQYAALFIAVLVGLHQIGVNVTPILAGVGILSLAIGFGAQTLVKDIINGLFILFEDSISVGDVVNIKGTGGLVEAVNLRTIRLRDLQGSVHVIPNSQVEMITNMTKEFSFYVLDVGVAYREDTDEVIAVLQEIDAGMRQDAAYAADMLEPIEILGVDRFTDSAVIIRARLKTKPIRQWYVGREFNRRMKKLFDERGIEIPFPHRTLYWGEPKRGEAAAMRLDIGDLERLTVATEHGNRQPIASKSVDSDTP